MALRKSLKSRTQTKESLLELVKLFNTRRWPEPCENRLRIADCESYPFQVCISCVDGLTERQADDFSWVVNKVDDNSDLAEDIPRPTSGSGKRHTAKVNKDETEIVKQWKIG